MYVPARALRWRQDVPFSSIEQCESECRRYENASGVVDAAWDTAPGSDITEMAGIDLLFERDASWCDDLGAAD